MKRKAKAPLTQPLPHDEQALQNVRGGFFDFYDEEPLLEHEMAHPMQQGGGYDPWGSWW